MIHFLRKYVKAPWAKDLKPENITLCDKEFVLQDFAKREADLIFKVRLYGREFYIYLLMELQSTVDFTMPFRLLIYMSNLWLKIFRSVPEKEREKKGFRLPVILPILFYNGEDRWTAVRQFSAYQEGGSEFGRHVLDFEYYLVDLSQIEEEDILSTNTLIDNIMALDKKQSAEDITQTLKVLAERIAKLPKAEQADFIDWMDNVMLKRRFPKDYIDNFNQLLREGGFQNMITYSIERILDKELEKERNKRFEKVVKTLIETCKELGLTYEETLNKLILRLDYDNKGAEKAMNKYWKQ